VGWGEVQVLIVVCRMKVDNISWEWITDDVIDLNHYLK